ncbi:choice-of-anchor D domain-containing protein [Candidatus Halobeggiatoa sp. HSG11]|nr:choice-of-anchor D domain-containing protein [Candidatus Halobeggiatoa sp. HSG11]
MCLYDWVKKLFSLLLMLVLFSLQPTFANIIVTAGNGQQILVNSPSTGIYFKVIDETGNPNIGATVNFNLTDPTGSKIIDGLSIMTAYTENNGLVSTSLNSAKTTGNYTIVATLETDDSQSANANVIVVENPNELNLPSLSFGMAIGSTWESIKTNTTFDGGIKVNNDKFFADVVLTPNDTVFIQGAINVDSNHVGKKADIIVAASYKPVASFGAVEEQFVMVDSNNALQIWDQDLASLVEFARIDNLPTQQLVNMYGGTLPLGKVQVYFAYRLDDGLVVFNGYQTINAQIKPAIPPDFSSIPEQDSTLEFSGKINTPITKTISITNDGDNPLTITSPNLSGQHNSNFELLDDFPISLGANESKTVTVQCIPSEKGERKANLEFKTNDKNSQSVSYPLECTGVLVSPPKPIYVSVPEQNSTLAFNGKVGTSITNTITIKNDGDATLVLEPPKLLGENSNDFQIIGDFPVLMTPNDSKTVTVQCIPSEKGERKADLEFSTNDNNSQLISYSLECTGIEEVIISPPKYLSDPVQNTTLEFSSEVGTPSTTATINITNGGDETLIINSSQLVGENPDDFTAIGDFPINILDANDSSKTVTVQCTPSEEGNRKANLEFETNDQNAQLVNYSLECNGIKDIIIPPPEPKFSSIPEQNSTLVFSSEIGTSITETITITNNGDATLVIESPEFPNEDINDFQIIEDFPISLNASDSKVITVQCTPSREGEHKANFEFITNDQNAQLVNYSLKCTGILVPPPPPPQNSTLVFSSEIGTSITETITITNNGDATLIIESPKLLGEDINDFQIIEDFPISLNASDSKVVTVQCTPSREGEHKANLEFTTNDQNVQLVNYSLECTGIKDIFVLPPQTFEESKINLSYHSDNGVANFLGPNWGYTIEQPNHLPDSASAEEAARAFLSVYGSEFGIEDQSTELESVETQTASGDRSFVYLQQKYDVVPIMGGNVRVQMDAVKNILSIQAETLLDVDVEIDPEISSDIASKIALAKVSELYGYKIDELTATKPELWVYNPLLVGFSGPDENRLVWHVEVSSEEFNLLNEFMLVDAHSGEIVLNFSQIMTAKNLLTYDVHGTYGASASLCRSEDTACNKAHDYAGDAYDFYFNMHNRDGIDGLGTMEIISFVHYTRDDPNLPPCNAAWIGDKIVYVDGCEFLIVDDIVAHEFTHGVTSHTSKLAYLNQSGAINESFSDIWGEFVDQDNGKGTDTPDVKWIFGEDSPKEWRRNLKNPELSYKPQPDKISSHLYECYCPPPLPGKIPPCVHKNGGVGNKAAYLMTDGDTFNGYNIRGLGLSKIAKLYYEVQTKLLFTPKLIQQTQYGLESFAKYSDLYHALNTACSNLRYSFDDCQQVKNALLAVEMNQTPCRPSAPKPETIDHCQIYGWYGDGICHVGCSQPDPDCSSPEPKKCQDDGVCDNSCSYDPDCSQPPPSCTPSVSSVSPLTATLDETTTFTVKGICLPDSTAFWIGECENLVAFGGNEQQRQFRCKPSWTTGRKDGLIKEQSGGNILKNFTVDVQDATPPLKCQADNYCDSSCSQDPDCSINKLPNLIIEGWFDNLDMYGDGLLEYTIVNTGDGVAPSGWEIGLFLGPYMLFSEQILIEMGPDGVLERNRTSLAPFSVLWDVSGNQIPFGDYEMAIHADYREVVVEKDEFDNISSKPDLIPIR